MAYKALISIGGFSPGDIVPDVKAEVWMTMYKVSPVELATIGSPSAAKVETPVEPETPVDESLVEEEPKKKEDLEEIDKSTSVNPTLDDYLARNLYVVLKNLKEDSFSDRDLQHMLELERADKKRKIVINTLKKKIVALQR